MSVFDEIGLRLVERLEYIRCQPERILYLSKNLQQNISELESYYPNIAIDRDLVLKPNAFDLVIMNQYVPWMDDLPALFKTVYEVMKPGACLLFSALGPDSFLECADDFSEEDYLVHTQDMHPMGDLLLNTPFENPVMDREYLKVSYKSESQMLNALYQEKIVKSKRIGSESVPCSITYEIIYGHAWKPMQFESKEDGTVYVSLSALRRL